jgi:hypothetical protein
MVIEIMCSLCDVVICEVVVDSVEEVEMMGGYMCCCEKCMVSDEDWKKSDEYMVELKKGGE